MIESDLIESDPNPPTGQDAPSSGGLRRSLGGSRGELLLGGVAALASMIFVSVSGRDFWFRYDNFEILTNRRLGSLDDWFRPHNDHWLTWTILVSRVLYRAVGMDFWPWWYLPRVVGAAAVAFLIWRTLLHRGADRMIAFGTYLVLLVLAVSYFQDALTFANYVLFPSVVVVALLVGEVDVPRRRDLVVVGACLLAALMANGYGVGLYLGVTLVVVVGRRFRRWAPSLIPPGIALIAWYLWYRSQIPRQGKGLSLGFPFEAIGSSFVVMRTAVQNTFGLPGPVAVLVVAAIAGQLVWLIYRRRLDRFNTIIILTLAFVLAVLAWARTTEGSEAELPRYGYAVVLLLTLVLVPRIRLPNRGVARTVARTSAALVLVAVVTFNAVSLHRRLHDTGVVGQSARATAQTTASLIAAGEPYNARANLGIGVLPKQIQQLVNVGWNPPRSTNPLFVSLVRARMRIVYVGPNTRLIVGTSSPAAVGVDDKGCRRISRPSAVNLRVKGPSVFTADHAVQVTWTDRFGTVLRRVGRGTIALAPPVGNTIISVRPLLPAPTKICSLRAMPPGP